MKKNKDRSDIPELFLGNDLIGEEEEKLVTDVIKAQSIFRYYGHKMLHRVDNFEEKLAQYLQTDYALCVSSGTAALKVAIQSLNLEIGDEIILPSFGFVATANAIIASNCVPIFADIDESMNISVNSVESLIGARTKAIICIHISGQSCDMGGLMKISKKYGIPLIEDVAQAFGGSYDGKYLGTIGQIGCFSFQSHKLLSTGEGGCVVTKEKSLYTRGRNYHDQGGERADNSYPKWQNSEALFGENLRMNEISASVGIAQLEKIPRIISTIKNQKSFIMEKLQDLQLDWRKNYSVVGDCSTSICFFVNDAVKRNKIIEELREIHANGSYNSAMYENYVFEHISEKFKLLSINELNRTEERMNLMNCKNSEYLSARAVWVPLSPLYTTEHIEQIINNIREVMMKYGK
jgi:8-amino-3,8-dideoxy-alpha-D-manno-octulosonate transaminase